jgi:hypothetical protein
VRPSVHVGPNWPSGGVHLSTDEVVRSGQAMPDDGKAAAR